MARARQPDQSVFGSVLPEEMTGSRFRLFHLRPGWPRRAHQARPLHDQDKSAGRGEADALVVFRAVRFC